VQTITGHAAAAADAHTDDDDAGLRILLQLIQNLTEVYVLLIQKYFYYYHTNRCAYGIIFCPFVICLSVVCNVCIVAK